MINLFRKNNGAATLLAAIILVTLSALIIIFAANHGQMLEKITGNQNRNSQAFSAAEAGLEFGIKYFQQNASTIVASPSGGYIQPFSNGSITNVTLANGSKFSIVYTNPVANNYTLIKITSTGVSADGSSTRLVTQQIAQGSIVSNPGTTSLVSAGAVTMTGSSTVTNTATNQTIQSGGDVTLSGSSRTTTSSGTSSTAGNIRSDITADSSSIQSMSQNDFIANFFGTSSTSSIKSRVSNYYNNSSSTNYSSTLNNMTGTSIWIDQTNNTTATISGNTAIGTASNPVLLIVNGNLSVSGNVTIYGFVFVIGSLGIDILSGNTQITGAMASTSGLTMSGNINVTFNQTVLNNLKNQTNTSYWAKVGGTWKDF